MKHRRLFSILLALALLCALTAPALAAAPEKDLDPPLWQLMGYDSYEEMIGLYTEYFDMTQEEAETDYAEDVAYVLNFMETRPEETAQFRANAYHYFEERYTYYDSPEGYMSRWNLTEEQFLIAMTVDQIWDVQAAEQAADQWAALCAGQPERTAQFLAEFDTWFAGEYPWYDSFEEYCENWGESPEEAYIELFYEWNWAYEYEQEQERDRREFITSHGGVPGQLNVMVNGKYVKFTDAVPEVAEGRTMVPFRAIFESLGAEVSYEDGKIHAALGDTVLDLTIGSDTMTKTGDGKTETVKMNCAPYAKNDRTYIPVRFISEAMGCAVYWDPEYYSAVIIDPDVLAAEVDKDFAIVNGLLAASNSAPESYKADTALVGDVTIFNSLDGDRSLKFTLDMDTLAAANGASGDMKYDFSDLVQLMPGLEELEAEDSEEYKLLLSLLAAEMKILVDWESGSGYVHMPALNSLYELMGYETSENTWFSVPLPQTDGQTPTVGSLIAANALTDASTLYYAAPALSYSQALGTAAQAGALFGDKNFTKEGGAQVLSLDLDSLSALVDEDSYYDPYDLPSQFALTLTIHDGGAVEFSLTCRGLDHDYTFGMMEYLISAQGELDGLNVSVTAELHVKNQLKAAITLTQTAAGTTRKPETTPPEGAQVLDVNELSGGAVTSPDGPTLIVP